MCAIYLVDIPECLPGMSLFPRWFNVTLGIINKFDWHQGTTKLTCDQRVYIQRDQATKKKKPTKFDQYV